MKRQPAHLFLRYRCACLVEVRDQRRVHEMLDAAMAGPCPECECEEVVEVVAAPAPGVLRCAACGAAAAGFFRNEPWCLEAKCGEAIRKKLSWRTHEATR